MKRVLPESRVVPVNASDPLFDGFFKVDPANVPGFGSSKSAQVMGVYEDNDPSKRLMVVAMYRTTLGHKWRYVSNDLGSGIEEGGAAYRLGINTYIYGLSH